MVRKDFGLDDADHEFLKGVPAGDKALLNRGDEGPILSTKVAAEHISERLLNHAAVGSGLLG
jgi:hypothetical protein